MSNELERSFQCIDLTWISVSATIKLYRPNHRVSTESICATWWTWVFSKKNFCRDFLPGWLDPCRRCKSSDFVPMYMACLKRTEFSGSLVGQRAASFVKTRLQKYSWRLCYFIKVTCLRPYRNTHSYVIS